MSKIITSIIIGLVNYVIGALGNLINTFLMKKQREKETKEIEKIKDYLESKDRKKRLEANKKIEDILNKK